MYDTYVRKLYKKVLSIFDVSFVNRDFSELVVAS